MKDLHLFLLAFFIFFWAQSAYAREFLSLENAGEVELSSIKEVWFTVLEHNGINIIVMPVNPDGVENPPNVKNDREKSYSIAIKALQLIIYDFIIDDDFVFFLINENQVYGEFAIKLRGSLLANLKNRTFDEEIEDIKSKVPPYFPIRKLLEGSDIVEAKISDSGLSIKEDGNLNSSFKTYLDRHVFDNYYVEILVEDNYRRYLRSREDIFDCIYTGDATCVGGYLKYGFDANRTDSDGVSLLFHAAMSNNIKIIEILLEHGADPNIAPSGYENAYLYAQRKGYSKVADRLRPLTKVKSRVVSTGSGSGSDMRNWCLGVSRQQVHSCHSINDDDTRNACLAMVQFPSFCHKIADSDMRNFCTATVEQRSFCHQINNTSMRQACLGINENPTFCHRSSGEFKLLCAGISMSDNNCYNL